MQEPSSLTENSTTNLLSCFYILPHATRSHPSVLEVYEQELVLEVPPLAVTKQHNSLSELGRGLEGDRQGGGGGGGGDGEAITDHMRISSAVRRYGADCVLSPLHDVNRKTLRPLFEGVRQGSNVSLLFASAPPPAVTSIVGSGGVHSSSSNMSNGTSGPHHPPPLPLSSLGDESVAVHLRLLSGLLPTLIDEAARTYRGVKKMGNLQNNTLYNAGAAGDREESFSLQCSASVFEVRVAPNASNQPRANGSNGALQQGVLVARDLLFNPTTASSASLPYSIVPQLGQLSEVQFTIDRDEEDAEISASACEGLWGEIMNVFRVERLASSAKNAMRTRSAANTQTRRNYLSNSDLTVSDPSKSAFFVLVKLGNWGPSILIGDVGHDPQLLHVISSCFSVASATSSDATMASIGKNLVGGGRARDAIDHLHRRSLLHELLIPFFCPTTSTTNPTLSSLMRVSLAPSLVAAKPTQSIVSSIICVPNLITRMEESVRLLGFVSEVFYNHSTGTTALFTKRNGRGEGATTHREQMPTLYRSIQRHAAVGNGARDGGDLNDRRDGKERMTAGGQEQHVPTRMMQEGEEAREEKEALPVESLSQHKRGVFDNSGGEPQQWPPERTAIRGEGDARKSLSSLPAASSPASSSPVAVVVVGPTHQTNISIDGSATQHYSFNPSSNKTTGLWKSEESTENSQQQRHSHLSKERRRREEESLSPSLPAARHHTIQSASDWRSELLVDYQLDDERRRSNGIVSGHHFASSVPTDRDRARKEEAQREDNRASQPSRPPPPPKDQPPISMSSPSPLHSLYYSHSTNRHHDDAAAKTGLERIAAETTPQPAERKMKETRWKDNLLFAPRPFEEIVIEGGDEDVEDSHGAARDHYHPQSVYRGTLHSSSPPPQHALRVRTSMPGQQTKNVIEDGLATREGSPSGGYADLRAAAVSGRRAAEQKEAKKAPSPPISATFRAASYSTSPSSSDSDSRSREERRAGGSEVRRDGVVMMGNESTDQSRGGGGGEKKGKGDMMMMRWSSPRTSHSHSHAVPKRRSPSVPRSRIELEMEMVRAASSSEERGGAGGHERREGGKRNEVFVDTNNKVQSQPSSSGTPPFLNSGGEDSAIPPSARYSIPTDHHEDRHNNHQLDFNRNDSSNVYFAKNNDSSNELQHVIHALRAQLRQTASRLRTDKEESFRKKDSSVGNDDELKQQEKIRGNEKPSVVIKALNKSSNRQHHDQLQPESVGKIDNGNRSKANASGTAGAISVTTAVAGVGSLGDMSDIVDALYKRIGDMEIMYNRDLQIMRSVQKENELLRRENELLTAKSKELEKSARDLQKKEISRVRKNALDRIYSVSQDVAATTEGEENNDSGEHSKKSKTMAIRRTPSHTFAAQNLALRESLTNEQAAEIKVLKRKTHNLERENETLRRKCGLPTMMGGDDDHDAHKYGSTTDIFASLLRRGGSGRQDLPVDDSRTRSRSPSVSMPSSSAKPSTKKSQKESDGDLMKATTNSNSIELFASIAANLGVQSSEGKRLSNFIQQEMNKVREQLRKAQERLVDVEGERDELKRMLKTDDPSSPKMSDHVSFVANAILKGCSRMAAMLTAIEAKVREKDFIDRMMSEKSASAAGAASIIGGPNSHHHGKDHSMSSDDHSKLLLSVAQHRDAISRLEASVKEIISRTSSAAAVLGVNGNSGGHVDANNNTDETAAGSSSSDAGAMDYLLTFEVERLSALRAFVPTYAHIAKGADQLRSYL